MGKTAKPNPNAVVASLEHYPRARHATGYISFSDVRTDMKVLEAKAEQIPGVRFANGGLSGPGQELEIGITAFHAQTEEAAVAVMNAVIRVLGLTVIDGGLKVNIARRRKASKKK